MADRDRRDIVAFLLIVLGTVVVMLLLRPTPPGSSTRTPLPLAEDQGLHPGGGLLDLSRDGSLLVYRRRRVGGESELWARRLSESDASAIPGTEGAGLPAISPDGREVAFTAAGEPARVRVVALDGSDGRTVADSAGMGGVRWSPDGAWLYYTNSALGLSRVPSDGGRPEVLTRADPTGPGEIHWGVEVLAGGKQVVYTSSLFGVVDPRIEVLDLATRETRDLWPGSFPRYSATGHLLFREVAGSRLMVARFDAEAVELSGTPVALATDLAHPDDWPLFAVSQAGTLVYARPLGGASVAPVWVDRDGTEREIEPGWRHRAHVTYSSLALSPADDHLALSIPHAGGTWDLWVKRLGGDAGPPQRVTSVGDFNYRPTWSPDGRSLTFVSDRAGQADLWMQTADDPSTAQRILDRPGVIRNGFHSPDGAWIVFREGEAPVADILAVPADRDGADAVAVVVTPAGERSPTLSPDGRWVAYTSNARGAWQVWLTAFLGPGAWRVSPDGGEEPVWAHSGRELFYRDRANRLVAVQVRDDSSSPLGEQQVLFPMDGYLGSDGRAQYDVSADDRRFVMLRLEEGGDIGLVRIDNTGTEFRRLLGAPGR